jgi:hypothetical protein
MEMNWRIGRRREQERGVCVDIQDNRFHAIFGDRRSGRHVGRGW